MRIVNIVFGISLVILLIAFASFKIADPDIMQYLANGRYMLSHGLYSNFCFYNYFPHVCIQAYLHEWLFHLVTYLVYVAGQWNGLVLFQVAISIALFSALVLAAKIFRYSFFSTGIILFFAILAMERLSLRADLFGLLLLTSFYVVVRHFIEAKQFEKKGVQKFLPLSILFLLQMLLTNIHASYPISFIIIFAYFLSYGIHFLAENYLYGKKGKFLTPHFNALLVVFFISLVASMLNPYGIPAFWYSFTLLFQYGATLSQTNQEWTSPFAPSNFHTLSATVYKFVLIPSVGIPFLQFRKVRVADMFLLFFFLYLSVSSLRNIVLFAVFAALILPYYLDNLINFWVSFFKNSGRTLRIISIGKVLCIIILIVISTRITYDVVTNKFYIANQLTRTFGLGISENFYPIAASHFIEKNNVRGNMFNDYTIGSYLNWRFYPTRKTFIDGHTFSLDSLSYYLDIMHGTLNYNDVARKFHINFFILNHTSPDTTNLIRALYADQKWVLVYFDELSVVFIANTPENSSITQKYAINFASSTNYDLNSLPTFKEKDDIGKGYINRGILFTQLGLFKEANIEFQKAVLYAPDDFQSYSGLGISYFQSGATDLAFHAFTKALELGPNYAPNHYNLGLYYYYKGMYDLAKQEYLNALNINSTYLNANYAIGVIYQKKGDIIDAKDYFNRELEINPGSAPAQNALNAL